MFHGSRRCWGEAEHRSKDPGQDGKDSRLTFRDPPGPKIFTEEHAHPPNPLRKLTGRDTPIFGVFLTLLTLVSPVPRVEELLPSITSMASGNLSTSQVSNAIPTQLDKIEYERRVAGRIKKKIAISTIAFIVE